LDAGEGVATDAPDYLKSATPPQLASYVGRAHVDVATGAHAELVSRGWEPLAAPAVQFLALQWGQSVSRPSRMTLCRGETCEVV
jgi:hypothetical protein